MSSCSNILCSYQLYSSCNVRPQIGSFRKSCFHQSWSNRPHRSSYFHKNSQFRSSNFVIVKASDSRTSRKQIEMTYNPEEKFNKLADEVDREAGLTRLTLFSPCKVNGFLRITGKRDDGYHDLAPLFHVISLGDKIKFSLSPSKSKDRLSTNVTGIIKALKLYREKTGTDNYFWVVQDIPSPIPFDIPMVLIKPQRECSTAEVYKRFQLYLSSNVDPLSLLEKISASGVSQDVCVNDLEPPAFEVLPSLKRLKQRVIAAGLGQYDAVFMSGNGSTIVGVGSPDPPQFVYDDEEYKDVFLSEASFITRPANQWYVEPASASNVDQPEFSTSFEESESLPEEPVN
ncbi:unnamed protein product [Withania somnifera]